MEDRHKNVDDSNWRARIWQKCKSEFKVFCNTLYMFYLIEREQLRRYPYPLKIGQDEVMIGEDLLWVEMRVWILYWLEVVFLSDFSQVWLILNQTFIIKTNIDRCSTPLGIYTHANGGPLTAHFCNTSKDIFSYRTRSRSQRFRMIIEVYIHLNLAYY